MAVQNTVIWFPPSMLRIADGAIEEIGGIMDFKKVTDNPNAKVLRLNMAEIVAGDPGKVEPNEVLHTHLDDTQWILFHTHPVRPYIHYLGLSGGDLSFMITHALTAPGNVPKVSHILLAPGSVHYTILSPRPYALLRTMLKEYIKKRENDMDVDSEETIAAVDEFHVGMMFIFAIAEQFIRHYGQEDDIVGMSYLDCISFQPTDHVTAWMLLRSRRQPNNYEKPFFDWFVSKIPLDLRNESVGARAEATMNEVVQGREQPPGLFCSWSMSKDQFNSNGVLVLGDNGYVYDTFVQVDSTEYDFREDIQMALRDEGATFGGGIPLNVYKGGRGVEVTPETLTGLAKLAKEDAEKHEIKDLSPHPPPAPLTPQGASRKSFRRRVSSSKKRRTYRVRRRI